MAGVPPLPDLGVPLRSRRVDGAGVRLHVVEAGPPRGPLVLLLHGFPEHWIGWRHQIPALARAGYRVWAPDQRGYHLSDKPEAVAAYDLDVLAADVLALLDAAGVESAPVVGHDWGAAVAWWTALLHPDRVERLVVMNVPHPVAFKRALARPGQMLRSSYMAFFQLPVLPEALVRRFGTSMLTTTSAPGTFSDADLDRYRGAHRMPGAATGMLNWYRAMRQRTSKSRPKNPTVRPPTLILWGDADRAVDPALADASLALCADGRLVRFPGVSHWVQHEAPERVNQRLLAFLGEV